MTPEQNFYIQYIMKYMVTDNGELFKLKPGRMLRYKQYKNRSYNRTWTHVWDGRDLKVTVRATHSTLKNK